jgi:hypothetical protein
VKGAGQITAEESVSVGGRVSGPAKGVAASGGGGAKGGVVGAGVRGAAAVAGVGEGEEEDVLMTEA